MFGIRGVTPKSKQFETRRLEPPRDWATDQEKQTIRSWENTQKHGSLIGLLRTGDTDHPLGTFHGRMGPVGVVIPPALLAHSDEWTSGHHAGWLIQVAKYHQHSWPQVDAATNPCRVLAGTLLTTHPVAPPKHSQDACRANETVIAPGKADGPGSLLAKPYSVGPGRKEQT